MRPPSAPARRRALAVLAVAVLPLLHTATAAAHPFGPPPTALVRAEGELHVSGSVRGGNPPEADSDADGRGSVEAAGQQVTTP